MTSLRIGWRATGTTDPVARYFRGGAIIALLLVEIAVLDQNYAFVDAVVGETPAAWRAFNETLQILAYVALYSAAAFGALALASSEAVLKSWSAAAKHHRWARWLVAQTALFLFLLDALPLLQTGAPEPPWLGFSLWLLWAAAMLACAAMALAPLRFWRGFVVLYAGHLIAALAAGVMIYAAITLSRDSWHELSSATLHTAFSLLQLYESGAVMDASSRMLGAGAFNVIIDAPCSGYEGIGLVLSLLSVYLFAFRCDLRFPTVLVLLPIGALTIWLLNTVRLALLVSIGAHVSPDVALNGFHSQAGWIFFLIVSIALMVIAHRTPMFRANAAKRAEGAASALNLASALLIPFALLMTGRLVAPAFGNDQHWLSAGLIALPTSALLFYRRTIAKQLGALGVTPILIGFAVGVGWIVTQPVAAEPAAIGVWMAQQTPAAAAAWLALRVFGFALIVPIAEELAFRGYLHRALSARDFQAAAPAAFNWIAFLVTSLLFGAMHGRWLAGALAGALFALALYRSRSLTGAIAAHVVANATIAAFAIALERWDLL